MVEIKGVLARDKAARAVCAMLDGTPGPLDAATVEFSVTHVVQIGSALRPPHNAAQTLPTAVQKRLAAS